MSNTPPDPGIKIDEGYPLEELENDVLRTHSLIMAIREAANEAHRLLTWDIDQDERVRRLYRDLQASLVSKVDELATKAAALR